MEKSANAALACDMECGGSGAEIREKGRPAKAARDNRAEIVRFAGWYDERGCELRVKFAGGLCRDVNSLRAAEISAELSNMIIGFTIGKNLMLLFWNEPAAEYQPESTLNTIPEYKKLSRFL